MYDTIVIETKMFDEKGKPIIKRHPEETYCNNIAQCMTCGKEYETIKEATYCKH